MTQTLVPTDIHTPATLIGIFADRLKSKENSKVIVIRGLYQAEGKKSYGGYFYDICKEEATNQKLKLKVPELIRSSLETHKV